MFSKIIYIVKSTLTFYLFPFLKKILSTGQNFLFFFLKIILKSDIFVIYFFTNTFIGYCIYIFCLFYGFFGCFDGNCDMSNFYATMLVIVVFSTTLQTYILLKIPSSRKFVELIVGNDFIESYLGKYSGSTAASMAKVATPVLVAAAAEMSTSWHAEVQRDNAVQGIRDQFYDDYKRIGRQVDLSSKDFKQMKHDTMHLMKQKPHGIITQGMKSESFKNIVDKVSSTTSSIFGGKK